MWHTLTRLKPNCSGQMFDQEVTDLTAGSLHLMTVGKSLTAEPLTERCGHWTPAK